MSESPDVTFPARLVGRATNNSNTIAINDLLRPKWRNGSTHNPKWVHTRSKAVAPVCPPNEMPALDELSSADVPEPTTPWCFDVLGGAGPVKGHNLLYRGGEDGTLATALQEKDPEVLACLNSDPAAASRIADDILNASLKPHPAPTADSFLKQVYFPMSDGTFHLLGIVPSSLQLLEHKTLMQAISMDNEQSIFNRVTVSHGGKHTNNVGTIPTRVKSSSLLPSLPPVWKGSSLPFGVTNSLHKWVKQPRVKRKIKALVSFLGSNPAPNHGTRSKRDALAALIIEDYMAFSADARSHKGWTRKKSCHLTDTHKAWLDPESGVAVDETDLKMEISIDIANILVTSLKGVPQGDAEREHWERLAIDFISCVEVLR